MQRRILFLLIIIGVFAFVAGSLSAQEKVDVNKATFAQLEKIPGIGPDMAKKIIDQRKELGSYKNVDQILQIKGIGPKTIEKIAPYLTIDGKPLGTGSSTSSKSSTLAPGTKININTASRSELDKLPGVGPKTADSIIEYRKANGPFKKPSDIKKVKGIGEKTYQKMADFIVVN